MIAKILERLCIFLIGAVGYFSLELMWRGYSHWTMAVTGGVCFFALYRINEIKQPFIVKCALGSMMITAVELAVGCVVNLIFELDVWDYSDRAVNLLGQICPLYSALWFVISAPAMWLCSIIKNRVFSIFERSKDDAVYLHE